jgi:hypothetical protein
MKEMTTGLGLTGFSLVFVASLVGYASATEDRSQQPIQQILVILYVSSGMKFYAMPCDRATVNQCMYYQGVNLGSSSMATAMTNLIPAITFVMAASVG